MRSDRVQQKVGKAFTWQLQSAGAAVIVVEASVCRCGNMHALSLVAISLMYYSAISCMTPRTGRIWSEGVQVG